MTSHHLVLKGRVPSKKNSKRRIQRGAHVFMVPSEAHEVWHEEQMWALKRQWPKSLVLVLTRGCVLTFFFADNRGSDLSNKAESVMDLLVDAGVIKDDKWQVIPDLHLKSGGIDKVNPRVEIELLL